jgi:4-amino-4-deoxy-L-arabinose transferase-like glycosyltransferase
LSSEQEVNPAHTPAIPVRHLLLLALAGGILFFAGLGRFPLIEPDEGRNAEVAREMLATGDFITPHYNGFAYLDKPAVYFWMVAGSFRLAGVNEWAARLPSALMAFATMFLVWFLARRMLGNTPALRAGLIFAVAPLSIAFSRIVIFDMTLCFLVTLAMVIFWLAQEGDFRRPIFDVVFFAALGVAAITKGPVGFLLPLLSILAFAGLTGRFRDLKRFRWGIGLLVFLAAASPWFIAVSVRNPDFPRYAFWDESLQRFATGTSRRGGSIFYYVPIFLAGFFPWSFFLLYAGLGRLREWRKLRSERFRSIALLLAWAGVIFVFFTLSRSKLPGYFLPAIVPLSILTARVWGEIETEEGNRPGWLRAGFLTMVALGVMIAMLPQAFQLSAIEAAASKKVSPAVLSLVKPAMFYSGVILAALGVFGRNRAARGSGPKLAWLSFALVAVTVPLFLVRWGVAIAAHADSISSRKLAQAILRSPERDLEFYGYYCFRTGMPFYLQRPVNLVTATGGEMTSNYIVANLARRRSADAPLVSEKKTGSQADLIDANGLRARALEGTTPFLALVRNRDVGRFSQAVPKMDPMWNDWEYSVWRIPPGRTEREEKDP